ncbi:MAG TPA: universal stress protein [Arachidicoccus sp.]
MKQILVATDFSACAGNAMEHALGLAKTLKISVTAIHAIGSNEGVDNSMFNAIYIEEYYNKKREALKQWVSVYHNQDEYKDIQVETVCEVGGVSNVLLKYISANEISLLVMGTMGTSGISGLFGTNVHAMVIKTKTPTLIVPLESKLPENPVITLATDFSTDLSIEDVTALNELIEGYKLNKLNVVNIISNAVNLQNNEQGENKLKTLVPDADLQFHYINESNASEGILNFIISTDTAILCLVKHHHNVIYRLFNKSTVNQVMNRSLKAVLVLHE